MIGKLVTMGLANPVTAPWVQGAQALWPLLWRAALGLALVWVGWHYGAAHERGAIEDERVAQLKATVVAVEAARAEEAAARERSTEVETRYEDAKLELDRVRADIPARVVRLCVAAGSQRHLPGVPAAPGVDHGASADQPDVSGTAGPDIGPELYALADQCDDAARRLSAAQEWLHSVPRRASAAPSN